MTGDESHGERKEEGLKIVTKSSYLAAEDERHKYVYLGRDQKGRGATRGRGEGRGEVGVSEPEEQQRSRKRLQQQLILPCFTKGTQG